MPKIEVNLRPETGVTELMDLFQKRFPDYAVYVPALFGVDFALKKSAWTGVAIKLIRKSTGTFLRINNIIPSAAARFFLGGLLAYVILMCSTWPAMRREITEYIETAPEFRAG